MSYDRGTTTKRTPRRLAQIIKAIPQRPARRKRAQTKRTGFDWHGFETAPTPNRAHKRRAKWGFSGHSRGKLPFEELRRQTKGERRRQRAHRRRMERR